MPTGSPPEQITPTSLDDYLEVMSKAVLQSGISWKVVESKWPGTREAFHGFDVETVAAFDEKTVEQVERIADTLAKAYAKRESVIC